MNSPEKTTQARPSLERKALKLMLAGDTGISSETMVAVALRLPKRGSFGMDAPYDSSDFGRCYRLVKEIPELREHFDKIGLKVKPFRGILKEWDNLVKIYLRDLPAGRSDELYRRIRELRGYR